MKYLLLILFFPFLSHAQKAELINEKMSGCDKSTNVDLVINRVAQKYIITDTLYLTIRNKLNCCFEPKTSIKYKIDTLYITQENISGSYCLCDCCFSQEFAITGIQDTNFVVKYNNQVLRFSSKKRVLFPDEYDLDFSTVNQKNSREEKIGLWVVKTEKSNYLAYFSDGKPNWYINYTLDGKRGTTNIVNTQQNEVPHFEHYELEKELKRLNSKINSELDFIDFSKFSD